MKRAPQLVTQDDCRSNTNGKCFYCPSLLGTEHSQTCVCRKRTVVVKVEIEMLMEYPESWDDDAINFHLNDSSWCANNIVAQINSIEARLDKAADGPYDGSCGCMCQIFKGEYVREATEKDEQWWAWRHQ